ncbi:hypothetical protein Ahy_B10g101542 [Arachis hypogaea]|uniref:Transposase Tnp1/En/Spm-like domain-containing protein n=1 Tax=Arachis hypogaea TaxID=3818 RepID=A0A444WZZ6_ARAHY|nr:hypothetical protein Ahy_B10g101542 [Arachis hypogaea]
MPRKPQYNIIREPPKDVETNVDTEETLVGSMTRGAQISREQPCDIAPPFSYSANRALASRINEPFHALCNDKRLAPSSTTDDPQTPTERTETRHRDEVADHQLEYEDYDLEADEVPSFDDHIDDLFAAPKAEGQNNDEKHKDTDYWNVTIIEDGVTKGSKLSVKEAIALPSNTKIILPFNKELQPIGQAARLFSGFLGSLGADYSQFPICEESWKYVNKAKKEHAYDMIKRVFYYEDDARGKIKREIMQMIGKNWKDTRHNLYHKCYKETRTFEENLKHRPSGIEENHWKWFLEYRQKEETKKKCKQNTLNRSKQFYTHTGGSKTLARKKDEVEKEQGRPIGRGELFIITHKKKMTRYIHPDARVVSEAIVNVERQDESSKHLSQNDSLAQVLGKKHPGRVHALGARPCPTQVFGNAAGPPSEEQAKRQLIEKVLGYLIQQQGDNLPADVDVELDYLGSISTLSRARPSSSGNHDPQQK